MRDYIAEANRFMYDDSYIVESESSVNRLKESLEKAKEELKKYEDAHSMISNQKAPTESIKKKYEDKINKAKANVNKIQGKLNHENTFNVEHHHTVDDIKKAYKEGHRGFKIKYDDPKREEKYEAAHTALYLGKHGITTAHSKNKKHYTVFAR